MEEEPNEGAITLIYTESWMLISSIDRSQGSAGSGTVATNVQLPTPGLWPGFVGRTSSVPTSFPGCSSELLGVMLPSTIVASLCLTLLLVLVPFVAGRGLALAVRERLGASKIKIMRLIIASDAVFEVMEKSIKHKLMREWITGKVDLSLFLQRSSSQSRLFIADQGKHWARNISNNLENV